MTTAYNISVSGAGEDTCRRDLGGFCTAWRGRIAIRPYTDFGYAWVGRLAGQVKTPAAATKTILRHPRIELIRLHIVLFHMLG